MYCVLISESRLIPGRNTAIFPEALLFAVLVLDCQRDDLFPVLQTVFPGRGTCPLPFSFPTLPPLPGTRMKQTGLQWLFGAVFLGGVTVWLGCSTASPQW